jgi:predicted transcriptional regulator
MKTKTMKVEILSEADEIRKTAGRIRAAAAGRPGTENRLVFRTIEDLRKFLTPERIRILRVIRHQRPKSVYELAKLAGRDRKSVITDLTVLERLGLVEVEKTQRGARARSVPEVTYSRIEIAVEV